MARIVRTLVPLLLAVAPAQPALAQVIPIRVVPVAEADQFGFFPSANFGMASVSIALADSLLDPVQNPALGARLKKARYFGGPTFFAVSNSAGSGQTFPLGGMARFGRVFAGVTLALQEIDPAQPRQSGLFPLDALASSFAPGPFVVAEPNRSQRNRHAHGTVGYAFHDGLSVGASGFWSDLRAMEGSELLFTGSHNVSQRGNRSELRLGAAKEWGERSLEAVVLQSRQDMEYDVGYAQLFWDPATRQQQLFTFVSRAGMDSRTDGVHLRYGAPLRDTTWRFGAVATANVIHESRAPYYEFMGIPRDPSTTRAYSIGLGVTRRRGPVTVALDALAEPAWRRASGVADTALAAIGPETNREESFFRFRNAVLRGGASRDFHISGTTRLRLQAGAQVRSVNYQLEQHDFLLGTFRERSNRWREWTHAWGADFLFSSFQFGYQLRMLSGMGRIGVPPDHDGDVVFDVIRPGFPLSSNVTLYPVRVTSHQMFITVPLP